MDGGMGEGVGEDARKALKVSIGILGRGGST